MGRIAGAIGGTPLMAVPATRRGTDVLDREAGEFTVRVGFLRVSRRRRPAEAAGDRWEWTVASRFSGIDAAIACALAALVAVLAWRADAAAAAIDTIRLAEPYAVVVYAILGVVGYALLRNLGKTRTTAAAVALTILIPIGLGLATAIAGAPVRGRFDHAYDTEDRPGMESRVFRPVADRPITWAFSSPQVQALGNNRFAINGPSRLPFSYILNSDHVRLEADESVVIEGRLEQGAVTFGLQQNDIWINQRNAVLRGTLRAVLVPPAPGQYRVVVANAVADTSAIVTFAVDRVVVVR